MIKFKTVKDANNYNYKLTHHDYYNDSRYDSDEILIMEFEEFVLINDNIAESILFKFPEYLREEYKKSLNLDDQTDKKVYHFIIKFEEEI